MGKKDEAGQKEKQRVQSVMEIIRRHSPLTIAQERFCSDGCVERFLKARGDSVKKAAKQLRSCLSWRDSIGADSLIADEFCGELAEGVAYVAGHDDELKPIMVFRIKKDYQKSHCQKRFTRLLVFTLEVALQTMTKDVDQFVLLFDVRGFAGLFRSASAFMNMLMTTLKIIADYYPGRLHRAFVVDPPSLFTYLWKGVRPFVELSTLTSVLSSLDYEDSLEYNDFALHPPSRAISMRFSSPSAKVGPCASSRFSFTVSHNVGPLKPWYLSLTDTSSSRVGPTCGPATSSSKVGPTCGPAISSTNARSQSFASSAASGSSITDPLRKNYFPSTPMPQRTQKFVDPSVIRRPRTPSASFLQSPNLFLRMNCQHGLTEKSQQPFAAFVKFYRRPYDETIYRSKMRPPHSGLVSIVSPQGISQRF